jgi:beta-lactamase class A
MKGLDEMLNIGSVFKCSIILLFLLSIIFPVQTVNAASSITANQNFSKNLSIDLHKYIKKSGGSITLQYKDLITGDGFQISGKKSRRAASTIKLPLILYIMEQASKGKINLNQKLTYKKYQYYGGSGVIQYQKVGTKYTIRDLIKKAMIHSDNIAFIMLRDRVGRAHFNSYMKSLGAQYTYPHGQNMTSANDLIIYAKKLYQFSETNPLGKEVVSYLEKTDFNTTIPRGIKGAKVAHKVGMIPMNKIYNDVGIIYDKNPFALAIMTNNISYQKSQKVIADIASIVYKHHKAKRSAKYFKCKSDVTVYQSETKKVKIGQLNKGETFKILSDKGLGYEIRFGKGKGYVKKKLVTALITPSLRSFSKAFQHTGMIKIKQNASVLNKSVSGKVIGIMNNNLESYYSILDHDYYVIDLGGRVGYVNKKYISVLE